MNTEKFELVAKTFQGLEDVLAQELRDLGADDVKEGRRMVSFTGDNEMLYRANLSCRTALRILKPIYKFTASDPDTLYEMVKEFDWTTVLSLDKTFSIDPVVNSDTFTHSRYVTYRVKDGIVDFFKDRFGPDSRPGVRLQDADVMINVHIDGTRVTLSLDSSGESLHKRGYRVAQTEAPINEVLAAGIILKSGWKGDGPLVDPMCGSGTFLIEAALIAANINPGIYRKQFAFEQWPDFDEEIFDRLYNDDSAEREVTATIYGSDISPKAIAIAEKNIKQAGVGRYIDLSVKPLSQWTEAPEGGTLITNPPYGERLQPSDIEALYAMLGNKLKNVFRGYNAWIIGYQDDTFRHIGLAPSSRLPLYNGALECELREYIIFDGDYKTFRSEGRSLRHNDDGQEAPREKKMKDRRPTDEEWRRDARKKGFGGRNGDWDKSDRKPSDRDRKPSDRDRKPFDRDRKPFDRDRKPFDRDRKPFDRDRKPFDRDRKPFDRDRKPFDRDKEPRRPGGDRFFGGKSFGRRQQPDEQHTPQDSENPLAIRRNEKALRSIVGRRPSILPDGGLHRGWRNKKSDTDNDTPKTDQ